MTGETTTGSGRPPGLPKWIPRLAGGILLAGGLFYAFLRWYSVHDAIWGAMGDAIAPFTALFNAGALFAALWAVHLQRLESHEAAESTRKQFEMMSRHVREATRAASATARLAKAQRDLVRATTAARLAQHSATIAVLQAALLQVKSEWAKYRMGGSENMYQDGIKHMETEVRNLLDKEIKAEKQLAELVAKGKS